VAEREARIERLESDIQLLAWLYAEQAFRSLQVATAMAAMLAQQMQPQMQQAILQQLTGAQASAQP
jgi:hypothetical protein